jgi:heme-degrading monooxygenase HmoA
MYGSVFRMVALPGKVEAVRELGEQWTRERGSRTPGYVGEFVYRSDSNRDEIWVAVVFESRETYMANADAPEQDQFFQKLRALLVADPEWHDGEVIYSSVGKQ